MNGKLGKIAGGVLFASFVAASASPSLAAENDQPWRWQEHHDFEAHRVSGQERQNLEYWRNKKQYDLQHHASRKKLAEDDNAIAQIENKLHGNHR